MKILEKGLIGNLEIQNRIVFAPMNVGALNNSDGCLSQRGIEYFTERAKGGVGLIVTGGVRITREFERSKETIPLWMAFADHKIHTGWINELAERCHDYGTKVAIQLTPGGGRQAGAFAQEHNLAISASSIPCFYPPHKNTRELTKEEIKKFVDAFGFSASIIKTAGADAIQLHGHEGYLMDQFTCALWNKRTDEYGGSLENRLRFIKEIIQSIKLAAGENFPIIYRYGLSHYIEGGRTIEEGLEMAKILESYGIAAFDIDAGCYENWYLPHPPSTIPAGFLAPLSEKVKNCVSIPVIISGKINYPEIAEKILNNKQADYISLGRPLIADPYWVNKVTENRIEDIRPCIGCHEGCLKRLMEFKSLSCAVNPAAGNEKYLEIKKAESLKKILVIGGGVAGMVAAYVGAMRGHEVVLIEKQSDLGGNFQSQFLPDFKNDYKKYIDYLSCQLQKLNVKVCLNTSFNEKIFLNHNPDTIILANGAEYKELNITGIEYMEKISVLESFSKQTFKGETVAVIGAGLVGTEAAINLAQNGAKVALFEIKGLIAADAFKPNRDHLLVLIKENNVDVFVKTRITKFELNKIFFENESGVETNIRIDKIVIATGMVPRKINLDFVNNPNVRIISIGDCVKPRKVIDAVWEAYRITRLI